MSSQFKFHSTNDPEKLVEMYTLCGSEWSGNLSAQEFGELEAKKHEQSIKHGEKVVGFYLEDSENGRIVATTIVTHIKGFYQGVERSNVIASIPDPNEFGVKNVTFLLVGYVFTDQRYRKKGLAQTIVRKAIEVTEEDIIKQNIDSSDESKNDSFKNMVTTDGVVDKRLANYYLSKQYFWVLYSGAGRFYEKFGFKAYPLNFYKIPMSIFTKSQEDLVENLINGTIGAPMYVGKRLKLLHGSDEQDEALIKFILQSIELEILTELNKQSFHSDLASDHKSSSSLTNMSSILTMSKLGSHNALASIGEPFSVTEKDSHHLERRDSSVHHLTVPKVALKPDYHNIYLQSQTEDAAAKKASTNRDLAIKFTDIKGAILTNELQQKSHYIIWTTLMQKRLIILGIGELEFESFNGQTNPAGMGGIRRRGSSFTGLKDLGGFNFQDLDLLINVAFLVSKNRQLPDSSAVYISVNDLPYNIPTPVLHDYFLNYLPKAFENVNHQDDESAPKDSRVEFITNASEQLRVLPMLRKFGNNSPKFDLDWISNCMWSWA